MASAYQPILTCPILLSHVVGCFGTSLNHVVGCFRQGQLFQQYDEASDTLALSMLGGDIEIQSMMLEDGVHMIATTNGKVIRLKRTLPDTIVEAASGVPLANLVGSARLPADPRIIVTKARNLSSGGCIIELHWPKVPTTNPDA